MIYYRRYSGDYLRKTPRLGLIEHGAYCLLLDYYYTDEQPLPLDRDEIYTMVRAMTPADRRAVDKVLGLYFTERADGYHNERADHEIEVSQKARANGKSGGRPPGKTETGEQTGTITGSETESLTGQATGSGHPLAVNHLAVSRSAVQPSNQPTASSAAEPPRAAAIAVLIRSLDKARGKASKVNSMLPVIQGWVEKGVTDEQIREAYELAVADREAAGESAAINAGFLDVFLGKLLNPKGATTRVNGNGKPWFIDSWPAIVRKGMEKGLQEHEYETPPAFKTAVLLAYGVTQDDVSNAQREWQ